MFDVFISYAREDESRIGLLVKALQAHGLEVFWDRQIPAGRTWREHIGQALEQARCVVVAWSVHSVASAFVAEEADEGRQRGVLVPVLLDAVLPPLGFRSVQAADLQGLAAGETPRAIGPLLAAIDAVISRSTASGRTAPLPRAAPISATAHAPPRTPWLWLATAGVATALGVAGWFATRPDTPRTADKLFSRAPRPDNLPQPSSAPSSTVAQPPPVQVPDRPPPVTPAVQPSAKAPVSLPPSGAGKSRSQAASPRPADPAASPDKPQPPAATAAPTLQVLEAWRTEGGGVGVRAKVSHQGQQPLLLDGQSAFSLLTAGHEAQPASASRPMFETLQRGESVDFELRFARGEARSVLRVTLPDRTHVDAAIQLAR